MNEILRTAILIVVTLGLCSQDASTQTSLDKMVENLTIIESPARGKRETTKKRFRYLLPRFAHLCDDMTATKAGDMLAFTYGELNDAGLEEKLLAMSNNLFSGINRISSPRKCARYLAAYVMLRRDGGFSPTEAREGIVEWATLNP